MSIIGISSTKDYLYIVATTLSKKDFAVLSNHRLPIDANDLASLFESLNTFLVDYNSTDAIPQVSILCCATGMYPSSPEAFKAEGLAELKCQQLGYPIKHVKKQGLKKILGCDRDVKWQDAAKIKFNSDKKITYFSSGFNGAISTAFGSAK